MDEDIDRLVSGCAEPLVRGLLTEYLEGNAAARAYLRLCADRGEEPRVDHITIRCLDVEERAKEFCPLGYEFRGERIEYPNEGWWAKVYRRAGLPALFVDQAYADARGQKSILPAWVAAFGDRVLHHAAVRVADIEATVDELKARGVRFSGEIAGRRGSRLRQVFTAAEERQGRAYSVLEITERNGYDGFVPEQADSLMRSSVVTRSSARAG